jgi:hypothetical protein
MEAIPTGMGGTGSTNSGGAIHHQAGVLSIAGTAFSTNTTAGGNEREGRAGGGHGGAIFNRSQMVVLDCGFVGNQARGGGYEFGWSAEGNGGAIMNGGTLHIAQSFFKQNAATGGHGRTSAAGQGGAIHNTNHLTVVSSTFDQNSARGLTGEASFAPPSPAFGGALSTLNVCNLTNVTFAANTAVGGDVLGSFLGDNQTPGDAFGGAVFVSGGTLALRNCTLSGNGALGGKGPQGGNDGIGLGGGICSTNAITTLMSTILAHSTKGSNCFGTLSDSGHNLSSDGSCDFAGSGSLNNTDPKLGPMGHYGGPTPTMPLLAGSPAIDGGDNANFPPTDQRGRTRPFGSAPDIGAFESSPPYVIAGNISGNTLVDEVKVAAGSYSSTTVNGHYSFQGLSGGSHSVGPTNSDYVFYPPDRLVTVGSDQINVNFKAFRLHALSLEGISGNALQLMYAGTNGHSVQLWASSNLLDWSAISTNTIGSSNLLEIAIPIWPGTSRHFYRTIEN